MVRPPVCPAFPLGSWLCVLVRGGQVVAGGPQTVLNSPSQLSCQGQSLGRWITSLLGGSGEAARDRDQLPADGGGGGFGVEHRRDGPGGAGGGERDAGHDEPSAVGCKMP